MPSDVDDTQQGAHIVTIPPDPPGEPRWNERHIAQSQGTGDLAAILAELAIIKGGMSRLEVFCLGDRYDLKTHPGLMGNIADITARQTTAEARMTGYEARMADIEADKGQRASRIDKFEHMQRDVAELMVDRKKAADSQLAELKTDADLATQKKSERIWDVVKLLSAAIIGALTAVQVPHK